MSEENLELAREGYDAWNRDDLDWFIEHMTDDAEMRPIRGAFDFDEVYHGHEGWTEFWEIWRESWSSIEVRVQRMQDLGDQGVLVLLAFEGVGRASGAEVSIALAHWLTFRDGKLAGITVMTPEAADRRFEPRG